MREDLPSASFAFTILLASSTVPSHIAFVDAANPAWEHNPGKVVFLAHTRQNLTQALQIMDLGSKHRIDRTAISIVSVGEQELEARVYWHDKTPHERLEAVETTRQILYGFDSATARLQRVFEVVERK